MFRSVLVFLAAAVFACCSSTKRAIEASARSAAEAIVKTDQRDTVAALSQDKRDVLTIQETESETIEAITDPEYIMSSDGGLPRCTSPGTRRTTTRTRTYTIDRLEAGKWIAASSSHIKDSTVRDEAAYHSKEAEKVGPHWFRCVANIGRVLLVVAVCFFAFKYRKTIKTLTQ